MAQQARYGLEERQGCYQQRERELARKEEENDGRAGGQGESWPEGQGSCAGDIQAP